MRSNIDTSTASSHDANCVTWIMLCFWWHKIPAHKLMRLTWTVRRTIQQLQQFQSEVYYWTAIDYDSEHYWLVPRLFCLWKCVTTWLSPPLLTVRSRRDVTPPAATTPNVEHTCCRVQLVWYTLLSCCATCLDFCSCRLCWRRTLVQQRHAITNCALAYDVCHTQNVRLKNPWRFTK